MISLDWKDRIKKDTIDFFQRKLQKRDYDIDIVYNAYPERIDNEIPHAVITLVGKTIASKLVKNADKYFDFYDYLLQEKGEHGSIIFAYIMARAIKKQPDLFLKYLEKKLVEIKDQKTSNLIMDKSIFPMIKKEPKKNLGIILNWIKKNNDVLTRSIKKILVKLIRSNPDLKEEIFEKLETFWLYATPAMVDLSSAVLKEMYRHDKQLYLSIFHNYKSTRNPTFAKILSGAICCYNEEIEDIAAHWSKSGNVKLKKIGLHSIKILKKKRR